MSRDETVEQYRERYWRKVSNRSTLRDKLIEIQLKVDQREFELKNLRNKIDKFGELLEEIGEIRQEQSKCLDKLSDHFNDINRILTQ